MTFATGTGPPLPSARGSTESLRLSPTTHRWPSGPRTGPDAACCPKSDPIPVTASTTGVPLAVRDLQFHAGPRVGEREHHDVTRRGRTETFGEFVDEDPVVVAAWAPVQRGLHRAARDDIDPGR